jgi:hypothetical protein
MAADAVTRRGNQVGRLSRPQISQISEDFFLKQISGDYTGHSERSAVGDAVCGAQSKNPVE